MGVLAMDRDLGARDYREGMLFPEADKAYRLPLGGEDKEIFFAKENGITKKPVMPRARRNIPRFPSLRSGRAPDRGALEVRARERLPGTKRGK
jgi:hypothetical protein